MKKYTVEELTGYKEKELEALYFKVDAEMTELRTVKKMIQLARDVHSMKEKLKDLDPDLIRFVVSGAGGIASQENVGTPGGKNE